MNHESGSMEYDKRGDDSRVLNLIPLSCRSIINEFIPPMLSLAQVRAIPAYSLRRVPITSRSNVQQNKRAVVSR